MILNKLSFSLNPLNIIIIVLMSSYITLSYGGTCKLTITGKNLAHDTVKYKRDITNPKDPNKKFKVTALAPNAEAKESIKMKDASDIVVTFATNDAKETQVAYTTYRVDKNCTNIQQLNNTHETPVPGGKKKLTLNQSIGKTSLTVSLVVKETSSNASDTTYESPIPGWVKPVSTLACSVLAVLAGSQGSSCHYP